MAANHIEQELLRLENDYWQAMKRKDVDAAMRLTDDPCIVTGAQGVGQMARRSLASMMNSARYTLNDFTLKDPHVRMIGDDLAILAYTVHEDLTVEGKPVSLDAADASMWIRRPNGWVCALHTESILGDPFGRDRPGASGPAH